ncbi:hypothetical protein [Endozoicomonas sp. SCSIO W0465]|uniref:hypothetical protein n=1 Tax=Endozoicomonas sp. SCSIO W0465 TaxID=2918516 RepID=UPI002075AC20|nr:hypothetical protein [Endozoicomonas sp. SCSIO W0465]USE34832.1 hypothetical protein MJO57_22275 [Endozoicomonas sp. SCSIO W0465]
MEAFLSLGCLRDGWQGIDEAVKGKPLNRALITSISSFYNGKGIPEKNDSRSLSEAAIRKHS